MSFVSRSRLVFRLCFAALLVSAPLYTACIEAGLQSGVFACDTDAQCPPGGFFCDNYFNTYMYFNDVPARPVPHEYWGVCNSNNEVIIKVSTPQEKIPAETCTNGVDDDGDGKADCLDLECQTSPTCRLAIHDGCVDGADATMECDQRLGFPSIRQGTVDDATTCPASVGYFGEGVDAAGTLPNVCLPRCRLYFPAFKAGLEPNTDNYFTGSDAYCNTIVDGFATSPSFEGNLICVHLNTAKNKATRTIQNDVCLPRPTDTETTRTDCSDCAPEKCLVIHYRDRLLLAWDSFRSEMVPVNNSVTDQTDKTAYYCLD